MSFSYPLLPDKGPFYFNYYGEGPSAGPNTLTLPVKVAKRPLLEASTAAQLLQAALR